MGFAARRDAETLFSAETNDRQIVTEILGSLDGATTRASYVPRASL